jgi:hypothetical protein
MMYGLSCKSTLSLDLVIQSSALVFSKLDCFERAKLMGTIQVVFGVDVAVGLKKNLQKDNKIAATYLEQYIFKT